MGWIVDPAIITYEGVLENLEIYPNLMDTFASHVLLSSCLKSRKQWEIATNSEMNLSIPTFFNRKEPDNPAC